MRMFLNNYTEVLGSMLNQKHWEAGHYTEFDVLTAGKDTALKQGQKYSPIATLLCSV